MKVLFDKIVVREPAEDMSEQRSEAGLILPSTVDKLAPVIREVVGVGPEVKDVVVGDTVLLPPHTGVPFEVDNIDYKVFRAEEVLVVL